MKKAFEQNVSRSKPRLRMGAVFPETDGFSLDGEPAAESSHMEDTARLVAEVKARLEEGISPEAAAELMPEPPPKYEAASAPVELAVVPNAAHESAPSETPRTIPVAKKPPPPRVVAPPPPVAKELPAEERREKLKERLRAVRENPRPEPLPPTVAEAGQLAVDRISKLQTELNQVKSVNLSVAHDLDNARRQAERATEEARLRMDEARRMASEMEDRAKLLAELEGELSALEGERDESLLALQDARFSLERNEREKELLKEEIAKRDESLAESLSEEERLATELEQAKDDVAALRRAVDAVSQERDTLARQVADLTRERSELLEARKALESVHRALYKVATRPV